MHQHLVQFGIQIAAAGPLQSRVIRWVMNDEILKICDYDVAFESRLFDAIENSWLVPFSVPRLIVRILGGVELVPKCCLKPKGHGIRFEFKNGCISDLSNPDFSC
jgi:hypothetical protein